MGLAGGIEVACRSYLRSAPTKLSDLGRRDVRAKFGFAVWRRLVLASDCGLVGPSCHKCS